MSRGFLLIDGSNIVHAANGAKPLSVGGQPTQAIYGFLRTLRPMLSIYSMLTPVVLWDGASWRKMKFPEYKENRDKEVKTKADAQQQKAREEAKQQMPFVKEALGLLGVRQMFALNYEADDLAGVLVKRYSDQGRKVIMISGDKDWVQLLRPNVLWIDPVHDYRLSSTTISQRFGWNPAKSRLVVGQGSQIEGFIGVPSPRAYLEMKALMGDIGDNIPGVGGIGPKGALDIVTTYGSVGSLVMQVADKSIDPATLPKKIADFAASEDKQDLYRRNMQLMDLTTWERPEWINMKITHDQVGVDTAKFEAFCNRFAFNSITSDLDGWLQPFSPIATEKKAA